MTAATAIEAAQAAQAWLDAGKGLLASSAMKKALAQAFEDGFRLGRESVIFRRTADHAPTAQKAGYRKVSSDD